MKVFILRKDNKYHTEYQHSPRLSGWDPIDPNGAPSQIKSIDGLFKNVIAYLKNVETAFHNMNIVIGRVLSKTPVSKQLAKLNGQLKHDIQALKNEAVSAWKICVGDIRNAAKQARKDAALPRKDANWNNLLGMLDDIDAEETGDEVIIALAAVKKEARWLMSEPASIKKLITTSLTKRLQNKKVFSSASQTNVNKIVKACDEILKIGEEIYKLANDATEVLKKGLPRKDSESKNCRAYHKGVEALTLRRGGIATHRADIDRAALKQRIEKKLQVCKEIVELWGSRKGGFKSSNDKDQIEADLEAIDKAEKFVARAQEVLKKLK